jgi:chromosome segregation ATPase
LQQEVDNQLAECEAKKVGLSTFIPKINNEILPNSILRCSIFCNCFDVVNNKQTNKQTKKILTFYLCLQQEYEQVKTQVDEKKRRIVQFDRELTELTETRETLTKQQADIAVEQKRIAHTSTRLAKETTDANAQLKAMEQKFTWIPQDKNLFGKANSQYDFAATDGKAAQKRLEEMAAEQEQLGKRINKKVMTMFDK